MGIRVTKQLGYGLKDLHVKRVTRGGVATWVPDDPRWDYGKFCADWQGLRDPHLLAYRAWIKENGDRITELAVAELGHVSLSSGALAYGIGKCLERDDVYWQAPSSAMLWGHLKNVVLFTPAEHYPTWRRHDDIIDHYEEQTRGGVRCKATVLKNQVGIHPYDGAMRRFREPGPDVRTRLAALTPLLQCFARQVDIQKDGEDIRHLSGGNYNQLVGRWAKKSPPLLEDPVVLRHFVEDWRPTLSVGALALIEYLGCFPDAFGEAGIVNSLRPMICVTWG